MKTIQLNKKDYPIEFNVNAYIHFDNLMGERGLIYKAGATRSMEGIRAITYAGLIEADNNFCLIKHDPELTYLENERINLKAVGKIVCMNTKIVKTVIEEYSHAIGEDLTDGEKKE